MSFDIVQKSFDRNNLIQEPWEGTYNKELVFFQMYLQEKYKNELFTVPLLSTGVFLGKYDANLVFFYDNHDIWLNKEKSSKKISLRGEKGKDENKKKYEDLKNKFRTSKKRFISFPVSTVGYEEDISHSYSLLYDKETKEIELFQRDTGDNEKKNYNFLKILLKKFFKDIFYKDIKVVYNGRFCIDALFYSRRCEIEQKYYKDFYGGDCLLWALWYLDVRLKNKHLSREKVVKKIMDSYDEVIDLGKDKGYSYKACELMIGYRHFIDNFTKQFIVRQTESGSIIRISRKKTPLFDKAKRLLKTYIFLMNSFIQRTFIENKKLIKEKI